MMRRARAVLFAALAVGVAPAVSDAGLRAQDAPRLALVLAGPSSLGVELKVLPRVHLRVDGSMSRTTFTINGAESTTTSTGTGLSVLFGLGGDGDRVWTYLAPRVALARVTFDDDTFADTFIGDALFGTRVSFARRVALFGEGGVRITTADNSTPATSNTNVAFALRSHLGLNISF